MAEAKTKLPVKDEGKQAEQASALREWRPFETLRREIDRVFDDFGGGFWRSPFRRSVFDVEPFWRRELTWTTTPAMDVAETDKAYEINAELPGMSESDVEVVAANGVLTIKGEKKEEKEERRRTITSPSAVTARSSAACRFQKASMRTRSRRRSRRACLTVTLPKKPEAQKPAKKIEVKAA